MEPESPSKNCQSEHLSSENSALNRALDPTVNQSSGIVEEKEDPPVEEKLVENMNKPISVDEQQNKIELMKQIYANIAQKQLEEQQKYLAEQLRKKKNKAKKPAGNKSKNEKEDAAKKLQQERREKIQKQLKTFVEKYKKKSVIDLTGSQISKFKTDQKQKLFKNLMMGFLQIKFLQEQKISPDLLPFHEMDSISAYTLARKLSMTIDECIIRTLLYPSTSTREKRFKSFYRQLNNSLADEQNFQMRCQILTNKIEPKEIPKKNEDFFYSEQKKKRISQRNSILLNQCEAPPEKVYVQEKQPEIDYGMKNTISSKKQENMDLEEIVSSLYYDKGMLEFLEKALKGEVPSAIIKNIDGLLQEEKYTKLREILTKDYLSVFKVGEPRKIEENQ